MDTVKAMLYWTAILALILVGGSVAGVLVIFAWNANRYVTAAVLAAVFVFIVSERRKW